MMIFNKLNFKNFFNLIILIIQDPGATRGRVIVNEFAVSRK